jgi:hypothetical protein
MGKQTQTTKSEPWKPAQGALRGVLSDATSLYNSGGFQVNPFAGDMVANQDPLQAQAYANATGLSGAAQGNIGMAQGAVNAAMDPNAQSAQFGQVVQNTIDRIMPQINSSFAGSGMTGSGLHAQNLGAGVSQGVAGVLDSNWQANQNRALQAAGMTPGLNAAMFGANDYANQYGGQAQEQAQNETNAQVLQDQQAQAARMQALQNYAQLIMGVGGQGQTQTSTQGGGGLMSALGLGLQAAPLIFSDERLKTDIERVGKTDDGLGVYTYRYKGEPTVHMGVMAQEVQKKKPKAVHKVKGLLAVDYGAL